MYNDLNKKEIPHKFGMTFCLMCGMGKPPLAFPFNNKPLLRGAESEAIKYIIIN
jgi:hypothetical protein